MNARTGNVVAREVEIADTRETRRKGLLGRRGLDTSAALVLLPCFSVHTAFMKFPIDVAFLNRDGIVVRIVHDMHAWRIAGAWHAHATIEFASGCLKAQDVRVGDRLFLAGTAAADSVSAA